MKTDLTYKHTILYEIICTGAHEYLVTNILEERRINIELLARESWHTKEFSLVCSLF